LVVDVGAVYDPATCRYDHHQREFTGVFSSNYKTKLSSAGLVYKHYGKEILSSILESESSSSSSGTEKKEGQAIDSAIIEVFYEKIYKDFMEHIDAIDNGVAVSEGTIKYHISSTLSNRVNRFNPAWNEPNGMSPEVLNERFKQAMLLTGTEFVNYVLDLYKSWWPARSIVASALRERKSFPDCPDMEKGQILLLPMACPWKDHLFELEKEENSADPILYVIYPDSGGSYRIQAVPVSPNSFDSRKKLPADWCGVRDSQLSEKVGIPGCIFVHASGFIGGHQTREGALHMAREVSFSCFSFLISFFNDDWFFFIFINRHSNYNIQRLVDYRINLLVNKLVSNGKK
jgi:uncharacterized UPF0160 family protein